MSTRRWWLLGAGALLLVAIVIAVLVLSAGLNGGVKRTDPAAAPEPIAPQLFKGLPRAKPAEGWRITPKDVSPKADSMGSRLGAVENREFFYIEGDSGASWVYGIDASTGKLLYPAVEIDTESPKCWLNAPSSVLCLHGDFDVATGYVKTAWVIDITTGKTTYRGSTDVEESSVEQIGQYAIGHTTGQGWWGIGAKGERTWRVTGSGNAYSDSRAPTLPPQRLMAGKLDDGHTVIFAVADGRVLSREAGAETQVYAGGYADSDAQLTKVRFYDEAGALLQTVGGQEPGAARIVSKPRSESVVVAVNTPTRRWLAFDHTGKQYADFLEPEGGGLSNNGMQVIGGRLLSQEYGDGVKQYDMKTGAELNECQNLRTDDIVGTDGTVYVAQPLLAPAHAVDITTCQDLWTLEGENRSVIRVKDTLLIYDYNNGISALVLS